MNAASEDVTVQMLAGRFRPVFARYGVGKAIHASSNGLPDLTPRTAYGAWDSEAALRKDQAIAETAGAGLVSRDACSGG